jgi:hypothetical protein
MELQAFRIGGVCGRLVRDNAALWLYKSHRMKDLTDPRWIKLKGILFLLVGVISATLLVLENVTLKTGVLLVITIWCFCRFYYFAFYVIEKYVDPGYKFSGLWSFACYLFKRRKN